MIRNWYDILPKEDFCMYYDTSIHDIALTEINELWASTQKTTTTLKTVSYIFLFSVQWNPLLFHVVSELSIISNAQTSHYHHPSSSFWTGEQLSLHCICICIRQAAAFQVTQKSYFALRTFTTYVPSRQCILKILFYLFNKVDRMRYMICVCVFCHLRCESCLWCNVCTFLLAH